MNSGSGRMMASIRRHPLLVLGVMMAMVSWQMVSIRDVQALPSSGILPGPDMAHCNFSHVPDGEKCCMEVPSPDTVRRVYKRNDSSDIPFGVRYSVRTAFQNPSYVDRLVRAYRKMKDLCVSDPEDPRGMDQQRRLHCSYCSSGLTYGPLYEIHHTWFFLPFHRILLYHHERILNELLGEKDLKLAFWDYDNDEGKNIPEAFLDPKSSLHDHLRNRDVNSSDIHSMRSQLMNSASRHMMQIFALDAETTSMFLGYPALYDHMGLLELLHNLIHEAIGHQADPFHDMGNFGFAARDPVFYAHHANVDRLWVDWLGMKKMNGEPRTNPTSEIWLKSRFTMYDEKKRLTSMAVEDVLDTRTLGYVYEVVKNDWAEPIIMGEGGAWQGGASVMSPALPVPKSGHGDDDVVGTWIGTRALPLQMTAKPVTIALLRPRESDRMKRILVLSLSFTFDMSTKVSFRVFINQPGATWQTPVNGNAHFAGVFSHLTGSTSRRMHQLLDFPIDRTLWRLGQTSSEKIFVTIVSYFWGSATKQVSPSSSSPPSSTQAPQPELVIKTISIQYLGDETVSDL